MHLCAPPTAWMCLVPSCPVLCCAVLQAWGVMEYQLGNYTEARRLFQEGVWADPGNKNVVFIFQVGVAGRFTLTLTTLSSSRSKINKILTISRSISSFDLIDLLSSRSGRLASMCTRRAQQGCGTAGKSVACEGVVVAASA